MTAITTHFDALTYIETLEHSGISKTQAKALAKAHKYAFSESLSSIIETILAIKLDITDLKSKTNDMESDIKLLKWMVGFVLGGTATLICSSVALIFKSFF